MGKPTVRTQFSVKKIPTYETIDAISIGKTLVYTVEDEVVGVFTPGKPVFLYKPTGKGAWNYRKLSNMIAAAKAARSHVLTFGNPQKGFVEEPSSTRMRQHAFERLTEELSEVVGKHY